MFEFASDWQVTEELYSKTVSRVWRNPWTFSQEVNDYFEIQMGYDEQKHLAKIRCKSCSHLPKSKNQEKMHFTKNVD